MKENQIEVNKLVNELLKTYLANGFTSAASINNGNCEDFALTLSEMINRNANVQLEGYAEVFWDCDMDDVPQIHCFVLFNDLYYDSESPEGVDDFQDLPIYNRVLI